MTTINDMTDLLRILRDQPEWTEQLRAVLLTKEVLELPNKVAALTESMLVVHQRLDHLETDVSGLKNDMVDVKSDVADLKADNVVIKADIADLKADNVVIKADIADLKADNVVIKADIADLKADNVVIKADVAELKTDMTTVKQTLAIHGGQLSRLTGEDYESHAARVAPRRLIRDMGTVGASLQYKYRGHNSEWLEGVSTEAYAEGRLSENEADDLTRADLIFNITTSEGEQAYVLAEVSITVQTEDVTRAQRRSALLQQTTGIPTLPAVVGESIDESALSLVEQHGIVHMQIPTHGPQGADSVL